MSAFLSRLIQLTLFRCGPQDMPPGMTALLLATLACAGTAWVSLMAGPGNLDAVPLTALSMLVAGILAAIVLAARNRAHRLTQTLTALFGASAVITSATLPLLLLGAAQMNALWAGIGLVAFFWSLMVDAHIWRHALEVSPATGLVIALILFAVSFSVLSPFLESL